MEKKKLQQRHHSNCSRICVCGTGTLHAPF